MPIKQITPTEAKQILDAGQAVYLDVRSIPEFTNSHPAGSINIPLMHYNPANNGMVPNPDFPRVTEANLPKDKQILVGCKMGGRSSRACEILQRIGYENLSNVDGGFSGNDHQKGWEELGLPVSKENGRSYEGLLAKTK